MLTLIFNTIKEILARKPEYNTFEAYIAAHNPQNEADIEMLERRYFDEQRRYGMGTFFHE